MSRPTTPLPSFIPQKEQAPFISPPRSSTHPVKPKHHTPHHPHRVHHHHHHNKSVSQSAIQPTTSNPFTTSLSLGDFLSKTTATAIAKIDSSGPSQEDLEKSEKQRERRRENEEAQNQEREKAQWREVEKLRAQKTTVNDALLTTLTTLSTHSTTTTRRLDYTYYALLSSLSTLTTTLATLHALSLTTSTFSSHLKTGTTTLTTTTGSQIEAADRGFKAQAARIAELEERMRGGRERMGVLEGRLEAVRGRVERSGERDREGRVVVARRVRVLWGVLGGWGVLVLVVVCCRHWPGVRMDVGRGGLMRGEGEGRQGGRISRSEEAAATTGVREDPVLKLFDDL